MFFSSSNGSVHLSNAMQTLADVIISSSSGNFSLSFDVSFSTSMNIYACVSSKMLQRLRRADLLHHSLVPWRRDRIHFEEVLEPLEEVCMVLSLRPDEDLEEIDEQDLRWDSVNIRASTINTQPT